MYLFWLVLWVMIIMSKPAIATFAPGVEAPVVKDTGTVGGATRCVNYMLPLQTLHQLRGVHVTAGKRYIQHIKYMIYTQSGNISHLIQSSFLKLENEIL